MKRVPFYRAVIIALFTLIYLFMGTFILNIDKNHMDFTYNQLQGLEYHKELMLVLTDAKSPEEANEYFLENPSKFFNLNEWAGIYKDLIQGKKCFFICNRVRNLMLDISDKSNLVLDPSLSSYYLIDILVKILPYMTEDGDSKDVLDRYSSYLSRNISIISQDPENRDYIYNTFTDFNFDNAAIAKKYMVVYKLLKSTLDERFEREYELLIFTVLFLVVIYAAIIILVQLVIKNYIANSEIEGMKEKEKILSVLERKNEELEQFAYVASHDLKEPVRMVANFATLLEMSSRDKLDKEELHYTKIICSSAKRIESMIIDFLDYARVSEEKEATGAACDCNQVLLYVLDNLGALIEENNAKIIAGDLPTISVNPVRFGRLLQNLISNAIRYRKKGVRPIVEISAKRDRSFWRFIIKDNGVGIDKAHHQKIFQPFKRLYNRSQGSGTGIGLAICKKIVENNGGSIFVESKLGEGSAFHFTIPVDI